MFILIQLRNFFKIFIRSLDFLSKKLYNFSTTKDKVYIDVSFTE